MPIDSTSETTTTAKANQAILNPRFFIALGVLLGVWGQVWGQGMGLGMSIDLFSKDRPGLLFHRIKGCSQIFC